MRSISALHALRATKSTTLKPINVSPALQVPATTSTKLTTCVAHVLISITLILIIKGVSNVINSINTTILMKISVSAVKIHIITSITLT